MGNGDGRRLLPVGDALNAQHGLVSVLLDTDAVFLVEADAFGIENRRGGKLAIRRDRRFAVGDDRHRAGLVDDEAAGELAVDVVDVHGDFRGLVLVLLEKPEQLGGAGRHGPERHALSVDADGRLICAADRDHVMIAEDVAAGGLHQIMGFDVDTPLFKQARHAHGIRGDGLGVAVDAECDGLACGDAECDR